MFSRLKKKPKKLQVYAKKLIPGLSQLFGKDLIFTYQEVNGQLITIEQKELKFGELIIKNILILQWLELVLQLWVIQIQI